MLLWEFPLWEPRNGALSTQRRRYFFQEEDGIRHLIVTGVQTCALPIFTYYGKNALYRNNRDGTFTDVTRESGLLQLENHWNSGAAFLDYDRDGHLDLFVSTYVADRKSVV